ncbi:MAG: efflux RND transporter periplasmic adaptor subunit [Solirubrobacterales bacterium]|nr:efflux RND transporter periplasmic adaptor subunit [Solirubrobacterales bacterium]
MKRIITVTAIAVLLATATFAGGRWWTHRSGAGLMSAPAAMVYSCPMHPAYRRDHPGDCPICGMHLTADRGNGHAASNASPDGMVHMNADRQEAIGVRLGVVSRVARTQVLRTTGRVAPDENRTYPIIAAVSGWIRKVESVTTGDAVKADQVLASFVPPQLEFDSAQQSYYTALEMLYRDASALPGLQPRSQARSQGHDSVRADAGIERMADGLRNLGVSTSQLREMAKGRQLVQDIRIESPVDGFVLKRNVSPGLRFDRGFEFYRIADLNRVWIVADVYRDQLPFIRRGGSARIASVEVSRALSATVSASEPIFDEATLTLKVRLEAANPNLALKPGMFVDVELPVNLPPALVVPADAIVDSGLSKTVFVECGEGNFEPRLVETGWRIGGEAEVIKGLSAGERIVTSGTFLVDSESRMKAAVKP